MLITPQLKVAVTGANGQLGHKLVKYLEGKVTLMAYDKLALNIADKEQVYKKLTAFAPDIIINAAAYTAVDRAELEPDLAADINQFGAEHLAQTAQKLGAVLVHVSTDYVFDGTNEAAYEETDATNPQGIYGLTKLAGEHSIIRYATKHIILRTAWVFCEHGNNFVKTMLRLAQSKQEFGVVSDQRGGPTYAGDIADAIISIISQIDSSNEHRWGIYHYSGAPYVTWHQFAKQIFEKADQQNLISIMPIVNAISTSQYPTLAKRPAFSMLNCEKIERTFGIKSSNWNDALDNLTLYK